MSIIALYKYENSHSSITNNFFNRKIKKKNMRDNVTFGLIEID